MDRQLELNLASEKERVESVLSYMQPVELAPRQVAALALIMGCGDAIHVLGQHGRRWVADKETISEKAKKYGLKCSGNTFLLAVSELENRRIVGVLRNTRPWTYAVSVSALEKIEDRKPDPIDALTSLACFGGLEGGDCGESRSVSVRSGQGARVRDRVYPKNPCPPVSRDSVDVTSGGETTDRSEWPAGLAVRMRRPWDKHDGLLDSDLVWAVETATLEPIRRLWDEAKVLEYVGCQRQTSDDEAIRFLTIVHHCATSSGINRSRMGVLVSRVKRGLDVDKTRHESDEWAAAVMARRNREAACTPSTR